MSTPRPGQHPRLAGTARRQLRRGGATAAVAGQPATAESLAEEVPIAFTYNGEAHAVMLATPCDLEDFARGFTLTQGIVDSASDILAIDIRSGLAGIECAVHIPPTAAAALRPDARRLAGVSGCGLCGTRELEDAVRWPGAITTSQTISARALHLAFAGLRAGQRLFDATGATHAAAFADATGAVLFVREDVGRHNALDKLVGAMAAAGCDAQRGFIVVTSRASVEMVQKAARAGVGVLAAVSAPTALAVTLADSVGLTLVGFVREARHTVYTHAGRLTEAPQPTPEVAREH